MNIYNSILCFLKEETSPKKLKRLSISCGIALLILLPFTVILNTFADTLPKTILLVAFRIVYAILIFFVLYNLTYKARSYKNPKYINYFITILFTIISLIIYNSFGYSLYSALLIIFINIYIKKKVYKYFR